MREKLDAESLELLEAFQDLDVAALEAALEAGEFRTAPPEAIELEVRALLRAVKGAKKALQQDVTTMERFAEVHGLRPDRRAS